MNIGEAIGDQLDQIAVPDYVPEHTPDQAAQAGHRIVGIVMNPNAADRNAAAVAVSATIERTMTIIVGPWHHPGRAAPSERSFVDACRMRIVTVNPWDINWSAKRQDTRSIVRVHGSIVGDPRYKAKAISQVPGNEEDALILERVRAMHATYSQVPEGGVEAMHFPRFWAAFKASDRLPKWEAQDAKAAMLQERAAWAELMLAPVNAIDRSNQGFLAGILVDKPVVGNAPGFEVGWLSETTIYGDDSAEIGYKRLLTRRPEARKPVSEL